MQIETIAGLAALIWLVVSLLAMARCIRTGRSLADALEARHPESFEALGCPRPGFFESARRTRFAQFVGRREFEKLPDVALSVDFEAYRKSEARLVVFILLSGAVLALLALAL